MNAIKPRQLRIITCTKNSNVKSNLPYLKFTFRDTINWLFLNVSIVFSHFSGYIP